MRDHKLLRSQVRPHHSGTPLNNKQLPSNHPKTKHHKVPKLRDNRKSTVSKIDLIFSNKHSSNSYQRTRADRKLRLVKYMVVTTWHRR